MSKVGTIIAPKLPNHLPKHCQWLTGQGAGVWFCLDKIENKNQYQIKRFSSEGNLDCDREFMIEESNFTFDITKEYQFTHISHCAKCTIIQNENVFVFKCLTT